MPMVSGDDCYLLAPCRCLVDGLSQDGGADLMASGELVIIGALRSNSFTRKKG
jgi:hypothetical protein